MSNVPSAYEIIALHSKAETTKYLALASCTFLVYDILITLPSEIRYVWGSRWSFARVAFHINRLWAPLMLVAYLPSLFLHHLSGEKCLSILSFYIYGTIVAMILATSVLITRIWAIYELKPWVLATLGGVALTILVPSIIIIHWQTKYCELAPNPAPDLVSGCRFNTTPLSVIPYIAPFLFDTGLFIMTIYKVYRSSPTPLMTKLIQDGTQYYAIVMGTFLFVGFSTLAPSTSDAINGSGLFVAVLSSMCARLILSTRSYYDTSILSSLEMSSVSGDLHFRSGEWRVQRNYTNQQTSLSRTVTSDSLAIEQP